MHVCILQTRVFQTVFIKSKTTSVSLIKHLIIFYTLGVGLIFVVVIGWGGRLFNITGAMLSVASLFSVISSVEIMRTSSEEQDDTPCLLYIF